MRTVQVVAVVVAALLVWVGIPVLVLGYHRRKRRRIREGAARVCTALGLEAQEDRVSGFRRGQQLARQLHVGHATPREQPCDHVVADLLADQRPVVGHLLPRRPDAPPIARSATR